MGNKIGLTSQQSQQLYGTPAYTGWGETEAMYDAKAKGLTSGGSSSGSSILQNAINSFLPFFNKIQPYEQNNPFAFDEKLARDAATAEYSPYYKELLTDYTSNIEKTKSRSQEDLQTTLEKLNAGKEYYTGAERRALDTSLRNTNEGYAGRGLFFSGVRGRDLKELQTESNARVGNYLQNYDYSVNQAKTNEGRTIVDANTALQQYTRDTERDKKYAIENAVLTRRGEAIDEYNIKKNAYYQNAMGNIS